jgi:hypothetical protein
MVKIPFSALRIIGTEDIPDVKLDAGKNEFIIKGRSIPEDSYTFYIDLIQWMEEYVKNPNPLTHIKIYLEYINSSSLKQIFFFLSKLDVIIKNGGKAQISWYCYAEDEMMREKCLIFKKLLNVPFEILEIEK